MQFIASTILIIALTMVSFGSSHALNCKYKEPPKIIGQTFVVGKNGSGRFSSLQEAIDQVPSGNDEWIKIGIKPGKYIGNVTISQSKTCIFIDGQNSELVTIKFDAHLITRWSATFSALADNLVVRGVTFENSYNRERPGSLDNITQAVAVKVSGDKAIFINCSFLGVQDTLMDDKRRHYFYSCYIEGVMDYIFGSGQSIYKDCMMNTTIGIPPYYRRKAYVTAQGRESLSDPSGFVFNGGAVVGEGGQIYLGRAYGPFSRVIFNSTSMSAAVDGPGWYAWDYQGKEGNLTYSEFNCSGKGADQSKRVPWRRILTKEELKQYSRDSFIDQDGWFAQFPLTEKIN